MTLVVAGLEGGSAWVVSDTLITGGAIELRDRQYQVKCTPRPRRRSDRIEMLFATVHRSRFALSGHYECRNECPLLGVKRTSRGLLTMSASDPSDGVIGRPSLWIAEDFGCCASG
jgi:hypothetical protein